MARSLFARLADVYEDRERRFTRREALKICAGAAAAIALPACAGGRSASRRAAGASGRVVVVGAGFAGLAAADALAADGWDVTVLEARNRVSGRVTSLHDVIPRKWAEGGGEWIGLNHPTWLAMAERFGLSLDESHEEPGESPVIINGRRLDAREAESLYLEMDAHLADMTVRSEIVKDAMRPWTTARAAEIDAQTGADWLGPRQMSDLCRGAITGQFEQDNGVPLDRMNLLSLLAVVAGGGGESYWTDSEVYRCRNGNDSLANALYASIGRDRVRLETPVAAVDVSDRSAVVEATTGARFECDAVVLAVAPSAWSAFRVTRDGAPLDLPRVQMGTAFKYLSSVNGPWWRTENMTPEAVTNGSFGYTWNSTGTQAEDTAGMILCGFSGGPQATRLLSLRMERHALLRREMESVLPGFERARQNAPTKAERIMVWPEDAWTHAAYSFPAPGEVTTTCRALADGVEAGGQVRLAFAGEHCAPAFVGYMEGALQSGLRAARRLSNSATLTPAAIA